MKYAFLALILMAATFAVRSAPVMNHEHDRSAHPSGSSSCKVYDTNRLKFETYEGDTYFLGQGVPQDYAKALHYYRQTATCGYADAQNKLGLMYQHALGVAQSYTKAAKWYLLSAEQGDPGAENNLGLLYERGQGVPKNAVFSYAWFDLSAINARSNPVIQRLAMQHMKDVSSNMTSSQIARAQAKALTWLKKHDRPRSDSY